MASASLSQLHDIHLPAPVSSWPVAPGYLALVCVVAAIVFIMLLMRHDQNKSRLKQQALIKLNLIAQRHLDHRNSSQAAAEISALLKQVALMHFPREQVAALQGQDWLIFMQKTSKGLDIEPVRLLLLESAFSAQSTHPIEPLLAFSKTWIKQRRRPWLS